MTSHLVSSPGQRFSTALHRVTALHASLVGMVVSFALGVSQLASPNTLFGEPGFNLAYDQGVYFGAALRVTSGALPYRDFTMVHPPGILLLLQPEALLGRIAGTGTGLAFAQIITVFVVAANAFLAGYLARSQGRSASLIAGLAVALWPFTVHVNALVELEPYLVLFTLLSLVFVTKSPRSSINRWLFFGGVAIGMAMSVKVWGLYPFIGLSIAMVMQFRKAALSFFGGVAALLAVIWGPFLILCPSPFIHDVIIAQWHRQGFIGTTPTSFVSRFLATAGLGDIFYGSVLSTSTVLVTVLYALLVIGLILMFGLKAKRRSRSEWTVFATCLAMAVGVLTMNAPNYTTHYAYVPACALAVLVGLMVGRVVGLVNEALRGEVIGGIATSILAGGFSLLVLAVLVIGFIPKVGAVTTFEYASSFRFASDLEDAIPLDSCTVSDFPNDLIAANRYLSEKPDCPPLTDPFGMYLVNDGGNQPHAGSSGHPIPNAFGATWLETLRHTDVVVQSVPFSSYFPWNDENATWFKAHFTLTNSFTYVAESGMRYNRYVYSRTTP